MTRAPRLRASLACVGAALLTGCSVQAFVTAAKVAATGEVGLVQPVAAEIAVGQTVTLSARSSSATAPIGAVVWTSSNSGIASVGQNGVVRGIAPGHAVIAASAGSTSGGASITVRR